MSKKILLGAHISIKGGFNQAVENGKKIGCTAIQIFTKSSRSWYAKKITSEEIYLYKKSLNKSNISIVIAHSSYLINLASNKKDLEKKSIDSLEDELKRCEKLSIPYLVLHPGSHDNQGEEKGIKKISKNLDSVLKKVKNKTMVVLETTAGQGTNLGYTFEQLKQIHSLCKEKRKIGICIDTCHIFAAGYNISTPSEYKKVIKDFYKIIGLKLLKVIHINGSKSKFGSRVDRHESIGKGNIPLEIFKLIMNDKNFKNIPKILETPKPEDYPKEIKLLKEMVK